MYLIIHSSFPLKSLQRNAHVRNDIVREQLLIVITRTLKHQIIIHVKCSLNLLVIYNDP